MIVARHTRSGMTHLTTTEENVTFTLCGKWCRRTRFRLEDGRADSVDCAHCWNAAARQRKSKQNTCSGAVPI